MNTIERDKERERELPAFEGKCVGRAALALILTNKCVYTTFFARKTRVTGIGRTFLCNATGA
jgi:hypothetical protein